MRPLIEIGQAKAITSTRAVAVSFRLAMPINLTRSFSSTRMVGTPSKLARPCARERPLSAGIRLPRRREIPPAIRRRLLYDNNDPHRAHLEKSMIGPFVWRHVAGPLTLTVMVIVIATTTAFAY